MMFLFRKIIIQIKEMSIIRKRVINLLLILTLMVNFFIPVNTLNVEASSTYYPSSLPSASDAYLICQSISVNNKAKKQYWTTEKYNGVNCFKIVNGTKTFYIKPSVFTKNTGMVPYQYNPDAAKNRITSQINSTNNRLGQDMTYMYTSYIDTASAGSKAVRYIWVFDFFDLESIVVDSHVNNTVTPKKRFTFTVIPSQVNIVGASSSNTLSNRYKPTVEVTITNTGSNNNRFKTFSLAGRGVAAKTNSIEDNVKIGIQAAQLTAKAATGSLTIKDLAKVVAKVHSLTANPTVNYPNEEFTVCPKNGYVYQVKYTSFYYINTTSHSYQYKLHCNNHISGNTKLTISYKISK